MKVLRKLVVAVAATAVVVAFATARPAHAQSPAANPAHGLVGVWTLNQDLSDLADQIKALLLYQASHHAQQRQPRLPRKPEAAL